MTLPNLPDEVWGLVISHLRRPLPRPTGKNERSSIRQPDLSACMRVNIVFNTYAATLLYTVVVTDDLHCHLYNIYEPPSAIGIRSKTQLLGLTRRLFLEYMHKGPPSYETLVRHGGHRFSLLSLGDHLLPQMCAIEAEHLAVSAEQLYKIPYHLSTLSTGAFLGGETHIWRKMWLAEPPIPNLSHIIRSATDAIADLLRTPSPPVICERAEYGPLHISPNLACPTQYQNQTELGPKGFRYCAHFGLNAGILPVVFGGRTRLYFQPDIDDPERELVEGTQKVMQICGAVGGCREMILDSLEGPDKTEVLRDAAVHIDVYLPPSMTTPEFRRDIEEQVRDQISDHENQVGYDEHFAKDRWSFNKIEEAPACSACGWCTHDI